MKRLRGILLFVLLIFTLIACTRENPTNNTSTNNMLTVAELTEREMAIISMISNEYAVFDFKQDSKYKTVSVWIEKYESGKLNSNPIGSITSGIEEKGSIMFAMSNSVEDDEQQIIHMGISDRIGSSVSSSEVDSSDLDQMSSVWGYTDEERIPEEGEMVLASVCYSNDKNGISTLDSDFYRDPEGHIGELEIYEVVYLLKVKFIK